MVLDMPLQEEMRTQRAIRSLKPDPVDDGPTTREPVETVVHFDRWGNRPAHRPSGSGRAPTRRAT